MQSIDFYVTKLGFKLEKQFIPAMAIVSHGDLTLWLAGPAASASRPMPTAPSPYPAAGTASCSTSTIWKPCSRC